MFRVARLPAVAGSAIDGQKIDSAIIGRWAVSRKIDDAKPDRVSHSERLNGWACLVGYLIVAVSIADRAAAIGRVFQPGRYGSDLSFKARANLGK